MGLLKLAISLFVMMLFLIAGKMNVEDDVLFFGLCLLLSAYVMHETVDNRTIVMKEEKDE